MSSKLTSYFQPIARQEHAEAPRGLMPFCGSGDYDRYSQPYSNGTQSQNSNNSDQEIYTNETQNLSKRHHIGGNANTSITGSILQRAGLSTDEGNVAIVHAAMRVRKAMAQREAFTAINAAKAKFANLPVRNMGDNNNGGAVGIKRGRDDAE